MSSGAFRSSAGARILLGGLFVAAALAVFGRTTTAYFKADDFERIWFSLHGRGGSGFQPWGNNFRPLTVATVRANHVLGGLDPRGYHLTNLGIHIVNSALVGMLAVRLLSASPRRSALPAGPVGAVAALAFLLSPAHSEAVAWMSGRADLLGTGCVLLCLLAWLRWPPGERGHPVVLVFTALALLSKESAIVLPVLLLVVEVLRVPGCSRRRIRELSRTLLPVLAVTLGYLVLRFVAQGDAGGYSSVEAAGSPLTWPLNAAALLIRSFLPGMPVAAWAAVAGSLLVAGWWAVRHRRSWLASATTPVLVLCIAAMAVCVAPVVGLGVDLTSTRGERLVYLSSTFAAVAVALLAVQLSCRAPRVCAVVIPSLLVLSGAVLFGINERWVEAGRLTQLLVEAEAALPVDEEAVLINLPDSVRGAYVGRNALSASLALVHGWTSPHRASTLSAFEANGADVRADVTRVHAEIWLLQLDEGHAFVEPGREVAADGGMQLERLDARRVLVTRGPDISGSKVWYYSDGQMHRVPR